jgi:hypothetical protein
MAVNIGTQLTQKLDEISQLHGIMQGISTIGSRLNDYEGYESLINVFVYVEARHNALFDDLEMTIRQKVLPIVAHINDGV